MCTATRLRKFAALSRNKRAFLAGALLLVAIIRVSLWILPFRLVRRMTAAIGKPTRRTRPTSIASIEITTGVIQRISDFIPGATCLTQAMAAWVLLSRGGHCPQLRIGVIRAGGQIKAHAWVECAGKVAIGNVPGLAEFTALPSL